MTPSAFAKELAAALAASLPDGFTATAEGETVTIESPDGTAVSTWPSTGPVALDLPIPGARFGDGVLHLWYGDEDAPVLSLPPIRL